MKESKLPKSPWDAAKLFARLLIQTVDIGVLESNSVEQNQRIRMSNRMTLYGMFLSVFFISIFLMAGALAAAAIVLAGFAALCSGLMLTKAKYYNTAPALNICISSAVVLAVEMLSLQKIECEYLLIAMMGMPLLMVDKRKWQLVLGTSAVPLIAIFLANGVHHQDMIFLTPKVIGILNEALRYAGGGLVALQTIHFYLDMRRDDKVIYKQKRLLVETSRMSELGLMAAGVAHEINNPLMVIRGRAETLRGKVNRGVVLTPEALVTACESIEAAADRVAKIVQGLKHLSRDGSADPFETCALEAIVQDVFLLCKDRIEKSGIFLKVEGIAPDMFIRCRSVQIGQVLVNLISNSLDAVAELPEKWIRISAKDVDQFIEMRVIDSGHGIPSATAKKMMQAFYTTKPVGRGTGLGLSISRAIIEDHAGELLYVSTERNTTFSIRIPKAKLQSLEVGSTEKRRKEA